MVLYDLSIYGISRIQRRNTLLNGFCTRLPTTDCRMVPCVAVSVHQSGGKLQPTCNTRCILLRRSPCCHNQCSLHEFVFQQDLTGLLRVVRSLCIPGSSPEIFYRQPQPGIPSRPHGTTSANTRLVTVKIWSSNSVYLSLIISSGHLSNNLSSALGSSWL